MKQRIERAARHELLEALHWYLANGGVAVAQQFEWEVQRALNLLLAMPVVGRPIHGGARIWALKRFPYTLVYRVQSQTLSVIAVAHQSREPGYWRHR